MSVFTCQMGEEWHFLLPWMSTQQWSQLVSMEHSSRVQHLKPQTYSYSSRTRKYSQAIYTQMVQPSKSPTSIPLLSDSIRAKYWVSKVIMKTHVSRGVQMGSADLSPTTKIVIGRHRMLKQVWNNRRRQLTQNISFLDGHWPKRGLYALPDQKNFQIYWVLCRQSLLRCTQNF